MQFSTTDTGFIHLLWFQLKARQCCIIPFISFNPHLILHSLHSRGFSTNRNELHFLALLAYFSVSTVRSDESENGIQVFDSDGNSVGLSKAAGEKVLYPSKCDLEQLLSARYSCEFLPVAFVQAVRETALSRAALFGTTAAVPNLLFLLLRRSVA